MAMEVLLDHGKLKNDRRWHSQSRGSMGDHCSGLHTATCASMPPDLRFSAIISDGGKVEYRLMTPLHREAPEGK